MVRGDLDWIVMKCLEKDRTRRYETANGLAMDIQRHLNNEPVVARPPSAAYRLQKFVRRNKVMVASTAAVVLVLVLGVLVSTWQAIRATTAESEQRRLRQSAQTAQANEVRQRQRAEAGEQSAQRLLYASDMSLAQQSMLDGNWGRARSLLAAHLPQPGQPDLRGFEWRYLWSAMKGDQLELRRHKPGLGHVPGGLARRQDPCCHWARRTGPGHRPRFPQNPGDNYKRGRSLPRRSLLAGWTDTGRWHRRGFNPL